MLAYAKDGKVICFLQAADEARISALVKKAVG